MGIAYNTSVVRAGLVLHLDAANRKSYPGSGTAWNDLSGNGNNGTLVNGPTHNSTNLGQFTFDAVNDYGSVSSLSSVDFITTFTIECVFTQLGAYNPGPIIEKYNWSISGKGGWGLRFVGGNLSFFTNNVTTGETASIGYNLSANVKYYVTVTYNNGLLNMYINGVLVKQHTFSILPTTTIGQPVYIAQRGDGSGAFNYISVNKVAMYNRALSATEVRQNFEALRGRYGI